MGWSFILAITLGLCLAIGGFTLAFRQAWVRQRLGRPAPARLAGDVQTERPVGPRADAQLLIPARSAAAEFKPVIFTS